MASVLIDSTMVLVWRPQLAKFHTTFQHLSHACIARIDEYRCKRGDYRLHSLCIQLPCWSRLPLSSPLRRQPAISSGALTHTDRRAASPVAFSLQVLVSYAISGLVHAVESLDYFDALELPPSFLPIKSTTETFNASHQSTSHQPSGLVASHPPTPLVNSSTLQAVHQTTPLFTVTFIGLLGLQVSSSLIHAST